MTKSKKSLNTEKSNSFYITIIREDDITARHRVSVRPPVLDEDFIQKPPEPSVEADLPSEIADFKGVFRSLVSIMDSYRNFISLTLSFAPFISSLIAERKIGDFAKSRGKERADLSRPHAATFELDLTCYREFEVHSDEVLATLKGAKHLPEVMLLGLVSSYDAFLSSLLRVVLKRHQEIILTSEKSIKFSDLLKFSSIDEARDTLIEREIEAVIRLSHQEQFTWMEDKFSMKLREGLTVWPDFVEICERRNLFTHTGGIVSSKYISNCNENKIDISKFKPGDRLSVNSDYFEKSVNVIQEIGIKLCFVFWRKFAPTEQAKADSSLNELSFDLIYKRAYAVVEALLSFATRIPRKQMNEVTWRMMTINLANSVRLQKRTEEAQKLIDKEDWSASGLNFQICAEAVKGNVEKVILIMKEIGSKGIVKAEDYRTWPVFRGINTDARFMVMFENIFKEPVISATSLQVELPQTDTTSDGAIASSRPHTKH